MKKRKKNNRKLIKKTLTNKDPRKMGKSHEKAFHRKHTWPINL